jgi:hypothetical protein
MILFVNDENSENNISIIFFLNKCDQVLTMTIINNQIHNLIIVLIVSYLQLLVNYILFGYINDKQYIGIEH